MMGLRVCVFAPSSGKVVPLPHRRQHSQPTASPVLGKKSEASMCGREKWRVGSCQRVSSPRNIVGKDVNITWQLADGFRCNFCP